MSFRRRVLRIFLRMAVIALFLISPFRQAVPAQADIVAGFSEYYIPGYPD
jgi:hypothetical protein